MIELIQTTNELNIDRDLLASVSFPELMTDQEITASFARMDQGAREIIRQMMAEPNAVINLMETLQNEDDWRKIRAGLTVLETYSRLLSPDQIQIVLNYLITLLPHKNSTVRRMGARTAGFLIASCAQTRPEKDWLCHPGDPERHPGEPGQDRPGQGNL